jgi:sugar phosphate isomerase/epimerase
MSFKIAAQLYTLRNHVKTASEFAGALACVKGFGYSAVQLSAIGAMNGDNPEVDAKLARKWLDDNDLSCIATHRDWFKLKNDTESEIEFHKVLRCDYLAIGMIPDLYRNEGVDGFRKWIEEAKEVGAKLNDAGIRFAYHNHAFEFERFGAGRKQLYDLFIETSEDLLLEVDVYWLEHAGVNPKQLFEKIAGRVPVIHLKDKEMIGVNPVMAPIGEGNLDWDDYIPAFEKAGAKWFCVEQDDCRRDPFDCLKASYDFLRSRGGK